jgi:hypothetical protein
MKIMDTHSFDDILSCTLYTMHLPFSPFLCYNSTRMLSSSYLPSALPYMDLYACTSFPLAISIPTETHLDFEIYVFSKDTSSVEIKN